MKWFINRGLEHYTIVKKNKADVYKSIHQNCLDPFVRKKKNWLTYVLAYVGKKISSLQQVWGLCNSAYSPVKYQVMATSKESFQCQTNGKERIRDVIKRS